MFRNAGATPKAKAPLTASRNEIFYELNQADKLFIAIAIIDGDAYEKPYHIKNPFSQKPDFSVASINYDPSELLSKAVPPEKSL